MLRKVSLGILGTLALSTWNLGCGDLEEKPANRRTFKAIEGGQNPDSDDATADDDSSAVGAHDSNEDHSNQNGSSSGAAGNQGGNTNAPGTPIQGGSKITGATFFNDKLLPLLNKQCMSCHAPPRVPTDTPAPLSIYSYDAMKKLLASGDSSSNNGFLNKIRGTVSHGGGNKCPEGLASELCQLSQQWHQLEFPVTDPNAPKKTALGMITDATALGSITGWAVDQSALGNAIDVNFYIDGPVGSGTKIGTVKANLSGADGNNAGDHAFKFELPEMYRDKKPHNLFAYAVIGNEEQLITSTPFNLTAYGFSQAGRDFYNANVRGALNGCQSCHTISYEQQFYALINPAPNKGGTATNNELINRAATSNGFTHSGGNRCGTPNGSPCNLFQQWWQMEFGN